MTGTLFLDSVWIWLFCVTAEKKKFNRQKKTLLVVIAFTDFVYSYMVIVHNPL